ncbi:hypothetical protein BDD43_2783 [Mucilaginibacter gracilis]|uniref:GLPGLI family protein n=1 Tax=Mucilaginibacter gracilis TaxID=423350 RepID=A0A495J2K4_9SPHI|nr:DUF6624 domain-containing protein [Mucilaginibacter gracilis]RKR82598.1 hypothetical protein BDD43_2783 [Mucilaginibacter gracilis]
MKYIVLPLLICVAVAAHAQRKFNPVLKRQLDSVLVLDQKYRELLTDLWNPAMADKIAKQYGSTPAKLTNKFWALQNHIDSANQVFLGSVIAKYGYPGTRLVGKETDEAAWSIIQHSPDIAKYIPIIKRAAETHQLPFDKYAMMYDRYLLNQNKEQVYGTQCMTVELNNGKKEPCVWPIQDAEHVNERRKKAGFTTTVEQNALRLGVTYRVVTMSEMKTRVFKP